MIFAKRKEQGYLRARALVSHDAIRIAALAREADSRRRLLSAICLASQVHPPAFII